MVVVYYTQTYFLDAAFETLRSLKKVADVHLLVEIAPESKKSTIIDVPTLKRFHVIENFKTLLGKLNYTSFLPYLEGFTTAKFVVFKNKKAFSPISFFTCRTVIQYIDKISPDVIHFDTISARSIGLASLAMRYKTHITVHDPVAHSGEASWKKTITKFLFYSTASNFFFYSVFAMDQFTASHRSIKTHKSLLRFQPFSFIRKFSTERGSRGKYILFFGRMSPYKGIDILLEAIPLVLAQYPQTKFVLAGSSENYPINSAAISPHKESIILIPEYLAADQLAELIEQSQFVVCPYRDATQSGVLMTAFAFGKPVVATIVGAFPEYISDGYNGLLVDTSPIAFAHAICNLLNGDKYLQFADNIQSTFSELIDEKNQLSFLNAYSQGLN